MSADEDIAPFIAKGCIAVLAIVGIISALVYYAIRGAMR